MSLLKQMAERFVLMIPERTEDGSGGYVTAWKEGEKLTAAVVRSSSTKSQIAEAAGEVEQYTVTVPRAVHLPFHAVIKRERDGKTFRITSDSAELKTPLSAGLDMAQATAEAWGLT